MTDPTLFSEPEPSRLPVRVNAPMVGMAMLVGGASAAALAIWLTSGSPRETPKMEPRINEQTGYEGKFPGYDQPLNLPTTYAAPPQQAQASPPAPQPTPYQSAYVPSALPVQSIRPSGPLSAIFAPSRGDPAAEQLRQQQLLVAPNDQTQGDGGRTSDKGKWLANAGNGGQDIVTTPFRPVANPYVLQAGTVIRAALLNSVNSDLPGDVVALVTEDVKNTATGDYLMIPAGARLFGTYNDSIEYGQSRAMIIWQRILFPDSSSQNIGSMAATDTTGASGIEGDVDRHPWSMAAAIAGAAAFSVLGQVGQIVSGGSEGQTNVGIVGAQGAANQAETIWGQIASRELNRKNTLTVPQGTQVAVMLSRDIITLRPYQQAAK